VTQPQEKTPMRRTKIGREFILCLILTINLFREDFDAVNLKDGKRLLE
jgi:hypothetical protein